MNYSEAIISGIMLGLFVSISVGPTLFAVIRYSMHHTYKAGIAFIIGVSISDILYVVLANLATESWSEGLRSYQSIIGYIGSAIFMIMGLYGFFKKYKPKKPKRDRSIDISGSTYLKIFLSGFLMNMFNPGVVLMWAGAALKVATYTNYEKILFFGVCLLIVLIIDLCKVFLAEKIRSWLTLRKIMYLNKTSSAIIFLFGLIILINVLMGNSISH